MLCALPAGDQTACRCIGAKTAGRAHTASPSAAACRCSWSMPWLYGASITRTSCNKNTCSIVQPQMAPCLSIRRRKAAAQRAAQRAAAAPPSGEPCMRLHHLGGTTLHNSALLHRKTCEGQRWVRRALVESFRRLLRMCSTVQPSCRLCFSTWEGCRSGEWSCRELAVGLCSRIAHPAADCGCCC